MNTRGTRLGVIGLLGALTVSGSAVAQAPAEPPRAPVPQGPRVVSPEKHGFDVVYKKTAGGHTWANWRDYLAEFAPQLFC